MEEKYCVSCEEWKPIEDFLINNKGRKCRICVNMRCREYKKNNREKISSYNKKYKSSFKEDIKEYNRKYNIENREAIQKRQTAQHKTRRYEDPTYKLSCTLRTRIGDIFSRDTKKVTGTVELLGRDFKFVRDWLQSQFIDGMTLENHGEIWHIDHVLPCAKFDMVDGEEQRKCFNWTNLQPMIANDNLTKNDHVSMKEFNNQVKKVRKYMEDNDLEETKYTIGTYDITQYKNK